MNHRRSLSPSAPSPTSLSSGSCQETTSNPKPIWLLKIKQKARDLYRHSLPQGIASSECPARLSSPAHRGRAVSTNIMVVDTKSDNENRFTDPRKPAPVPNESADSSGRSSPPTTNSQLSRPQQDSNMTDATEPAAATIVDIVKSSKSPSDVRKKKREEKEAEDRRRVTAETIQKTAELAKEGIDVRDFALELAEREMAERNRRADVYQAFLREQGEDEYDRQRRERLEREIEEDEMEDGRMKGGSGSQGSGDLGDPMDTD